MSQAFNGIGTVVAPVLGSYVLFNFDDQAALANVQWVYLSIAAFVLLLAILFLFSNIPEITDAGESTLPVFDLESMLKLLFIEDMAHQAEESHSSAHEKPFIKQYRLFHAAFAQFCYCGAQVAIASMFINYATETRSNTSDSTGSKFFAGAQAAFTVGRFLGVLLMKYVKPRMVFLAFLTMCIVFLAPAAAEHGNVGISLLYCVLFFESICFPTIVALGMRGLGRHTKRGSGFIVGAVIGGACVPPLTGVAADRLGTGRSMVVPLAFFLVAWSYPLCVNFVDRYRKVADSFETTSRESHIQVDIEKIKGGEHEETVEKPEV